MYAIIMHEIRIPASVKVIHSENSDKASIYLGNISVYNDAGVAQW